MRRLLLVAGVLASALVIGAAASGETTVKVWFLQGEQLVAVSRPGSTVDDAMRALLAGPTPAERKQGFRTYVPARTTLNDVTAANGLATVDVGLRFALGGDAASLDARVAQLVHTAVGLEGVVKVRLLIDGGVALGMFPGIETTRPITLKYLETPNVPVSTQPPPTPTEEVPGLKATQDRLVALGYMLSADADGKEGPQTQTAVLAFQKWEGLTRDGVLDD